MYYADYLRYEVTIFVMSMITILRWHIWISGHHEMLAKKRRRR